MVVLGAGRHAIEVLDVLEYNKCVDDIVFFDNTSSIVDKRCFDNYDILRDIKSLGDKFRSTPNFIIAVGSKEGRKKLSEIGRMSGGQLDSIISKSALIGKHDVMLSSGLNIMHHVIISSHTCIGEGTLINAKSSIHHDCVVGKYCEIGPNCTITGNVHIGDFCTLGTGVRIVPDIRVGDNVTIGAGAVVTTDLKDNTLYVGVPAREV